MIYIIGCGGVGSWLTPAMCMLVKPQNITLVDGDMLEDKNLNRQLFSATHIGMNKAEALASLYNCIGVGEWYSEIMTEHSMRDWLLVGVDNHPARNAALKACDMNQCCAIFGANEVHSSEAFVYLPEWKGTNLDPRVYYPEIASDRTGDPRASSIGCTGEAQEANRQLVTANFMAASLMAHLFVVWGQEREAMEPEATQHLPHKLVNNLSRNQFFKAGIPKVSEA